MKKIKYLFLAIAVMFSSGCTIFWLGAGAGFGVAGYKFVSGELTVTYVAPYERVWTATVGAVKFLSIKIDKIKKDHINGYLKGKKADGRTVVIKVENKPSNRVDVKIKIGVFGDEEASLVIKRAIDRRLGIRGNSY